MVHRCYCGRVVAEGCECWLGGNPELAHKIRRAQESPTVGYVGGVRLEPSPKANRLALEVDIPEHYSPETVEQLRKALEHLAEYARLFAAKQEAYGRGNVDGFGELGVLVRLNDKVERLKNLIYRGKSNDLEAVEDTWLDVIGYGLIGLMIRRGRW